MFRFIFLLLTLATAACTSSNITDSVGLPASAKVALMPLTNNSQTPMASEKAESILASIWYNNKLPSLYIYPQSAGKRVPLLGNQIQTAQSEQWLQDQDVDYVLKGSIEEWRYKSGLDGEPVVAVTLSLFIKGEPIPFWTGTAARSGWGRDNLAATAQTVFEKLLNDIDVER